MNRILTLLLIIAVAMTGINADAKAKRKKSRNKKAKTTIVEPAPYGYDYLQSEGENLEISKYPPEYPGGNDGLVKFLSENINYPDKAREQGLKGRVILQFIVEKDGSVSNVQVLKSVHPLLDKEAVRVVKKMKRFVPGYNEDHAPVRTLYTLPINFQPE
jgi:protein TonB